MSCLLWSSTSKEITKLGGSGLVSALYATPAGDFIVARIFPDTSSDIELVRKGGTERLLLSGHTGFILATAFSSDGSHLVSAASDRQFIVWNCATGSQTHSETWPTDDEIDSVSQIFLGSTLSIAAVFSKCGSGTKLPHDDALGPLACVSFDEQSASRVTSIAFDASTTTACQPTETDDSANTTTKPNTITNTGTTTKSSNTNTINTINTATSDTTPPTSTTTSTSMNEFTPAVAVRLVKQLYGRVVTAAVLDGYEDLTFMVTAVGDACGGAGGRGMGGDGGAGDEDDTVAPSVLAHGGVAGGIGGTGAAGAGDGSAAGAGDGKRFLFKISRVEESAAVLASQHAAMRLIGHTSALGCAHPIRSLSGHFVCQVRDAGGRVRLVRLLTFVPDTCLQDVGTQSPSLLHGLGAYIGRIDAVLASFSHMGACRIVARDPTHASLAEKHTAAISNPTKRRIVEYYLQQFSLAVYPRLQHTRRQVIVLDARREKRVVHDKDSDANGSDANGVRVVAAVDVGNLVYTHTVCEPAHAVADAVLPHTRSGPAGVLAAAVHVVSGYHEAFPLGTEEVDLLFHLVCARLCVRLVDSSLMQDSQPGSSADSVWKALELFVQICPRYATNAFRAACGLPVDGVAVPPTLVPGHEEPAIGQHVDAIAQSKPPTVSCHAAATEDDTGPDGSPRRRRAVLLQARRTHSPSTLRLSYSLPLEVTGGCMQYLYAADGRTYLDAYNNIAHVGHCHPRVLQATVGQALAGNTNTRYLGQQLAEYGRRLAATMPDGLDVCFFVCSGSEANDLALRLARVHTGREHVVVVDAAYHGNTTAMLALSPYKFNGKGGAGPTALVRVVPAPDVYRGPDENHAGQAADVFVGLQREGNPPAAFFCESVLGCGGQIVPPEGYLRDVFAHARSHGAVCVVDEVQAGFGRVGSHMWAFELQGVVPDIVTLGKPMGNGHPIAAVVTTRAIADSWDRRGMEFFSSFGGTLVSCAVGLAVLDVIQHEGLMAHALAVGTYFKKKLVDLGHKHALIGDVRGVGLFLGVELVTDRATKYPATGQAGAVVEFMRREGVLTGRDGPFDNVIKIKPPLVFTAENADRFVDVLDAALRSL